MFGKSILNPLISDIKLNSNLNISYDINFYIYNITSFTSLARKCHFQAVGVFTPDIQKFL